MSEINLDTKIEKLFDNNFFDELKNFIFDSDLTTFVETCFRRKEQLTNKVKILDIINPEYSSLNIYNFKDFWVYFSSNKIFQYQVEVAILQIKYLVTEFFDNKNIFDETFDIKLSSNIIQNFYKLQINKLLTSNIRNLYDDYYDNNPFIKFEKLNNINDFKVKLILFIINYTLNYTKEIVENIVLDIRNLFNIYELDTKYKLNSELWNTEHQLSEDISNKRKQLQNAKYNKNSGRNLKNHSKINTVDIEELKQHITIAKEIINRHKNKVKEICKLNNLNARVAFENYVKDLACETKILLKIYFEENFGYKKSATVDFCAYKAMNDKFALDFFNDNNNEFNSYEAMKKFVSRHKKEKAIKVENLYSNEFNFLLQKLTNESFDKDFIEHFYNQILGQN